MTKLALIGDSEVQHYTVADRLWELIAVVTNKNFRFEIMSLATPEEVGTVFEKFRKDRSLIGFGITAPWKSVLADRVDKQEALINAPAINMVYRDSKGVVVGANTEPLAAQLALEAKANLYKRKSVLVIGADGAGLPLAYHLSHNLDKTTYLYDPSVDCPPVPEGVNCLSSLHEVAKQQYDVIINATPLGRYYIDKRIDAFTSPLDLETLDKISHKETIVQETNYLPGTTLLLQMARHLKLQVVTGDLMLVFEALESLKRYFGITLDENTVHMLVEEISTYIAERETAILEQSNA